MAVMPVSEQVRVSVTPGLYQQIRREWLAHSIAEDRRDIPGLQATLAPDCVYEYVPTGDIWHGLEGAADFYRYLLSAFPDIHFDLRNLVIGPQGVWEEAHVIANQEGDWLIYPAQGKPVEFEVFIFFPWDPECEKFAGERVFAYNFRLKEVGE